MPARQLQPGAPSRINSELLRSTSFGHPPLSLEWSVASRHGRSPQVSSHVHGKISLGRFGTMWTTHHSPRTKGAAYLLSTGHQCFEQEKIGLKLSPFDYRVSEISAGPCRQQGERVREEITSNKCCAVQVRGKSWGGQKGKQGAVQEARKRKRERRGSPSERSKRKKHETRS